MKSWLLVADVLLLAQGGEALETCAPRQCQRCSQNVECHCSSSGKMHTAQCRSSYVDYFDGRTGEALCAPGKRFLGREHWECLKEDARFLLDEVRVLRVNGTMICSDLMKNGCVQFRRKSHAQDLKCWCESLKEVISMHTFGIHLSIYDGHTGELLCPEDPRPGDCTNCVCAKKFTKAAPTPSSTPTAPTLAPTPSRRSQTVSSEPAASTPRPHVPQTEAERSTPTTSKTTQPPTNESAAPAAGWEGACAVLVGALCVGAFLAIGVVALCAALIIDSRRAQKPPSTR